MVCDYGFILNYEYEILLDRYKGNYSVFNFESYLYYECEGFFGCIILNVECMFV